MHNSILTLTTEIEQLTAVFFLSTDKFLLKLMVTIVLPFGLAILFITIVCIKFGPPCKSNVEDKSQIEVSKELRGLQLDISIIYSN